MSKDTANGPGTLYAASHGAGNDAPLSGDALLPGGADAERPARLRVAAAVTDDDVPIIPASERLGAAPIRKAAEHARITVTRYSAKEVIDIFLPLYRDLDFSQQVADMGGNGIHFLRRARILRECRALAIALWGVALRRSFPEDAQGFFAEFMRSAPPVAASGKGPARLASRVNVYADLLAEKGDADFLPVADYFTEVLELSSEEKAVQRLKLSLYVRQLYMLIFDKLV